MQISTYNLEYEITKSRTSNHLKHKNFSSKPGKKGMCNKSSLRNKTKGELRIWHDPLPSMFLLI